MRMREIQRKQLSTNLQTSVALHLGNGIQQNVNTIALLKEACQTMVDTASLFTQGSVASKAGQSNMRLIKCQRLMYLTMIMHTTTPSSD